MSGVNQNKPDFEAFKDRCKRVMDEDAAGEDLVREFQSFNDDDRVKAWLSVSQSGADNMPLARYAHKLFAMLVLDIWRRNPNYMTPADRVVTDDLTGE